MRIFYRACRVSFETKPTKPAGRFERAMLIPAHISVTFHTPELLHLPLPTGPDGGG